MKLRLLLALVLGFGLAYAWQHKPLEVTAAGKCSGPWKSWPQTWRA